MHCPVQISVVNLVMAVGLAVDYSLHVVHTFCSTPGASRPDRARSTMLGIAAAILLAFMSTLVGVVILAGGSSVIIRIFFQLLIGTVVFGGFAGLAAVPVLLTVAGPPLCLTGQGGEGHANRADAPAGTDVSPSVSGNVAIARRGSAAPAGQQAAQGV